MTDARRCESGHEWDAGDPLGACPECGAPGEPPDELPPPPGAEPVPARLPAPPRIDGYDVGELLGRGGMAVVYKAHQRSLNRPVALKVMLVDPFAGATEATRVRAEAEAIARLQHPNVVHVYEVGEQSGRPYLLMEFVGGGTLADRLRQGPIPTDQAAAWAEAIARGIHAAHARGIVHRDLKPANVLLTPDGTPKITDFGIARRLDDPADRTRTGLVVGTPTYMAPEQAAGRKGVGPPADVWAVGAILYEMLTGRPPFDGETSLDLLRRITDDAPRRPSQVRPGVPPGLEAICLTCLAKDPADRYATAEALAYDLAQYRPAPAGRRRWRPGRVLPTATGIVLLAAAVGWWKLGGPASDRPSGRSPEPVTAGSGPSTTNRAAGEPRWDVFPIAGDDPTFERVAFPSRDVGFAVSSRGVYRTEDGGQTWTRRGGPVGRTQFIGFSDADHGWLGTDRLLRTTDGGATWTAVALPGPMAAVRALAIGADGWGLTGGTDAAAKLALFRWPTGSERWERIDPTKWDGPARPHRDWFLGGLAVAGTEGWAALFTPAGGGLVLHTADAGDTWEVQFRPGVDAYHIHFADARRGRLAGAGGQLWATTDGGRTWLAQENPAAEVVGDLAFDPTGSFGLAPILGGGRVLMTDDGRTWRAVPVGLTGTLPAAAVADRGRAYVLSRDGHVARYSDPRVRP